MPRKRLTEAVIRGLRTDKAQEDIFHDGTPSAGIRVTREGGKTFFALYRSPVVRDSKGEPKLRRITLGEHPMGRRGQGEYLTLAEFIAKYEILRGDIRKGIDPQEVTGVREAATAPRRRMSPSLPLVTVPEWLSSAFSDVREATLAHLMVRWFDAARSGRGTKKLAPRTLNGYLTAAKTHILKPLGRLEVTEITSDVIEDVLKVVGEKSPQMVRQCKKVVSGAYEYGKANVKEYRRIINPSRGIKVNVPKGKRDRWLSEEELKTFLCGIESLSDPLARDVYSLILSSGCRPGEAAGVQAEDILTMNGERVWKIRYKVDRDHLIPLIGPIAEIINRRIMAVGGKGPLFWQDVDRTQEYPIQLKKSDAVLRVIIKLKDIRPHDLRRTMRTHVESMGVRREVGEALLNHAKGELESTYALYNYWIERKDALHLWHRKLASLTSEVESQSVAA